MRKNKLFTIGVVLLSILLVSCASEEITQKQVRVEFTKTSEMQNFEKKLRNWHSSKGDDIDLNIKATATEDIEKATRELLVSLGKTEIEFERKSYRRTDEYVRMAMREYSKKLTEMYNHQNKQ